jgi:hypothetical protein
LKALARKARRTRLSIDTIGEDDEVLRLHHQLLLLIEHELQMPKVQAAN